MAFPNMRPTTRSFTMGDYPTTTYRSMSGTVFKRSFGNKQTGYQLDLTFKNIGDDAEIRRHSGFASAIINHYNSVDGTFKPFTVPDRVFDGMGGDLEALIQAPGSIQWRYAQPPKVQSVKSGVSTVTVKLVAELNA